MRRGKDPAAAAAPGGTVLCRLADVADGGSNGFAVHWRGELLRFMILRRNDHVFVYANRCPHKGLPLDFRPGRFLDLTKTCILCTNHGALFRIEDGFCVSGPCAGTSLRRPATEVRNGTVTLVD